MEAMKWVEAVMSRTRGIRRIAFASAVLAHLGLALPAGHAADDAPALVRIAPAAQIAQPDERDRATERKRGPRRPPSVYGGDQVRVPDIVGGQFHLPELIAPTTDTADIGDGTTPDGFRGDDPAPRQPLPENLADRGIPGRGTLRTWAAPNTFANPRYFEDRMLERHGHERFGHLQPLASGVRFFATVPALPYLSTVRPPWECEYTLGYYRAGSCIPPMLQRPPYERRAALVEAASVAGAILIFP